MDLHGDDELSSDMKLDVVDGPYTLTVEGEIFTVRARSGASGTYDYTWDSGPNSGY